MYPAGSWGPATAERLIESDGIRWLTSAPTRSSPRYERIIERSRRAAAVPAAYRDEAERGMSRPGFVRHFAHVRCRAGTRMTSAIRGPISHRHRLQ